MNAQVALAGGIVERAGRTRIRTTPCCRSVELAQQSERRARRASRTCGPTEQLSRFGLTDTRSRHPVGAERLWHAVVHERRDPRPQLRHAGAASTSPAAGRRPLRGHQPAWGSAPHRRRRRHRLHAGRAAPRRAGGLRRRRTRRDHQPARRRRRRSPCGPRAHKIRDDARQPPGRPQGHPSTSTFPEGPDGDRRPRGAAAGRSPADPRPAVQRVAARSTLGEPRRVRRGRGRAYGATQPSHPGRRCRARTAAASWSPAPAAGSGSRPPGRWPRSGAEVVLAVRNQAKGEAAAAQMTGFGRGPAARRRRPVLGAGLRRGPRPGRRADQQRRGAGRCRSAHSRGRVRAAASRPTTSATSRSPTCCCPG